jgi:hypothetical protein
LPTRTLLYVSVRHIFISLTSFEITDGKQKSEQKNGVNIPSNDSRRIMYDTANLPTLKNKENRLNSRLL